MIHTEDSLVPIVDRNLENSSPSQKTPIKAYTTLVKIRTIAKYISGGLVIE